MVIWGFLLLCVVFVLFLRVQGFEIRTLHLLGGRSTAKATPPAW
jgi:hypothetical protein